MSIISESFEVWNSHTNSPFWSGSTCILSYLSLILSLIRPPTLGKVVQGLLWYVCLKDSAPRCQMTNDYILKLLPIIPPKILTQLHFYSVINMTQVVFPWFFTMIFITYCLICNYYTTSLTSQVILHTLCYNLDLATCSNLPGFILWH